MSSDKKSDLRAGFVSDSSKSYRVEFLIATESLAGTRGSQRWVRVRLHKIPHFKLGNALRFRESERHEWMESFRQVGDDHAIAREILQSMAEEYDAKHGRRKG